MNIFHSRNRPGVAHSLCVSLSQTHAESSSTTHIADPSSPSPQQMEGGAAISKDQPICGITHLVRCIRDLGDDRRRNRILATALLAMAPQGPGYAGDGPSKYSADSFTVRRHLDPGEILCDRVVINSGS